MPGPRPANFPGAAAAPTRTIAEVVDSIFTRFDGNSNATITLAELMTVLDPDGHRTGLEAKLTEKIAAIDGNSDGSLSKAEVTSAVTAADTNGDGNLSRADRSDTSTTDDAIGFLVVGRGHGPGGPGGPGDGGSRPEPTPMTINAAAEAIFVRVDADDSSTINLAELLAVLDPSGRGGRHADLAENILAKVDTNGDAALSVTEVTAALTALDTNGDGSLSRDDHLAGQAHEDGVALIGVLLHHMDLPA